MITANQNRVIKPVRQSIYINGALTNQVKCINANSESADFIIPAERFDSRFKETYHGKKIAVKVNNQYIFCGFIDTTNADLAPEEDSFTFSANSVLNKLRSVYVGQQFNKNLVTYRRDKFSLVQILKDIFAFLPYYSSTIRIGNTSVLEEKDFLIDDYIIFRNSNYESALETIISYCGDVAFNPRFTSWGCYIDFYRVNSPKNATTYLRLAQYGENGINANIETLTEDANTIENIDKVIVYGSPRKFIISCFNDLTNSFSPEFQLLKGWDESLESIVISNPDVTKRGNPGYILGSEFVFKRFYLPEILHSLTKLKDLPIINNQGQHYKLQAYQWKSTLSADKVSETAVVGVENAEPTIVDCQFDLDNNFVIFKEPATNLMQVDMSLVDGYKVPHKIYQAADIGITIAIENDDHILSYDTLSSKIYPNTLQIIKEDLTYVQYTNINYPIEGFEFDTTVIFFEDVSPAEIRYANSPIILQNDKALIQQLAEEVLKEKKHKSKQIDITIPFFTTNCKIGNKLIIRGTNEYAKDNLVITNVEYDLDEYKVTISADNNTPLRYSEI